MKEVSIENVKTCEEKFTCDVWFKDNTEFNYVCLTPTDLLNHTRTVNVGDNIRREKEKKDSENDDEFSLQETKEAPNKPILDYPQVFKKEEQGSLIPDNSEENEKERGI